MSKELSYLEAIREALAEEMRRDPKVFVLGEDVGAYGGAFGVTQGLYEEFGDLRVLDTPSSESARGAPRVPARRRDAIRRFHLVRVRSDREPGGDPAVSLRWPCLGADCHPCP